MEIQPDLAYTIQEAADILKVATRKLHRVALKHSINKIDNRYIFDGSFLIDYFNLKSGESLARSGESLNIVIDELRHEIKYLKEQSISHTEYSIFEKRLLEWLQLQKDLEYQDQLFEVEKKSNDELLTHYKAQFEYQKEQSLKILEMHQKLIETIKIQTKNKDIINED